MSETAQVTLHKMEDHEGFGICAACGREGLRWIARLSDGSGVGTECAKAALGFKPAPKSYNWVADYRPVAEHTDAGAHLILWQHKTGTATRETTDGYLTAVGGVRAAWTARGWC